MSNKLFLRNVSRSMREIEAPLLLTMHYLTTTKPAELSAAKLRHSLGQRVRHGTVLHPAECCAEQLGPWRGVQQPLLVIAWSCARRDPHRGVLDARELAMAGCSSIAYLSNHSCSCLAPLLERRAPHAWAKPCVAFGPTTAHRRPESRTHNARECEVRGDCKN